MHFNGFYLIKSIDKSDCYMCRQMSHALAIQLFLEELLTISWFLNKINMTYFSGKNIHYFIYIREIKTKLSQNNFSKNKKICLINHKIESKTKKKDFSVFILSVYQKKGKTKRKCKSIRCREIIFILRGVYKRKTS